MLRVSHVLLALLTIASTSAQEVRGAGPNIVFILVDDLGWRDVGCYGGNLAETPRLDRLAAEGMRFTDAYAPAPICSASRAALLTGRSPARLHFEFVTKPKDSRPPVRRLKPPAYTRDLPLEEITIPEALKSAGYFSGFFGKWHLNEHHGRYLGWSPTHGPLQQGFDVAVESFGSHPYAGKKGNPHPERFAVGQFPPDAMTQHALQFLEEHKDRRFFLMVSHFYVHTPVRAPTKWLLDKYKARTQEAGPGDPVKRAHYGAFVETLDYYVGQVLDALERLGLAKSTLVVFTSDNGGHPVYCANAPLRGSKWNLYEAGIRVPLIVRWPGHVPEGSLCHVPVIGTDLLPTFCAVTGASLPARRLDGQSLATLLQGNGAGKEQRAIVWHFPYYHPEKGYEEAKADIGINDFTVSRTTPQSAIRIGAQKLLHFYEDRRAELYDLRQDLSEQHDLSLSQPAMAQRLKNALMAELRSAGARFPESGLRTSSTTIDLEPDRRPESLSRQ